MVLKSVRLKNFRNFNEAEYTFNSELTIIVGENALGKTNLLEAIFFNISGIGFRETKEIELIRFDSETEAFVEAIFEEGKISYRFKIMLQVKNEILQKIFLIGNTKRPQSAYRKEQTRAVLFTPQQIEILTGSPQRRRDYFNKLLSSYDYEYKKKLDNFESSLKKRNKLLQSFYNQKQLEKEISFWNTYLEEQAAYLTHERSSYVAFLNAHATIDSKTFEVEYKKNVFSRERVQEFFQKELFLRKTFIGPQKDDFQIRINSGSTVKDVHSFGSRSEQRLTILWLKLNEIRFHEKMTNKNPVLLFDDIFSELDSKNKKLVIDLVKQYQTIATTTEKEIVGLASQKKKTILL